MKIIQRIQGAKGSRIQVKGMEVKTPEPSNPGILESYFRTIDFRVMSRKFHDEQKLISSADRVFAQYLKPLSSLLRTTPNA